MLQISIPSAIWHEAHKSADLSQFFADELRLERAFYAHHEREADRSSGVCWSGMGPSAWVGRTPQQLFDAALAKCERARAFSASPQGRFLASLSDLESDARSLLIQIEEIRNASSRSWTGELRFIDVRAQRLEAHVRGMVTPTLDIQLAVGDEFSRLESMTDEAAA